MTPAKCLISGMISGSKYGLPGHDVELWATQGGGTRPLATTRSGPGGRFAFADGAELPDGGLHLQIKNGGGVLATAPVVPAASFQLRCTLPGRTEELAEVATRFSQVSGHLVDKILAEGLERDDLLDLHRILSGQGQELPDRLKAVFPELDGAQPSGPMQACACERGLLAAELLFRRGWLADLTGGDNDLPGPLSSWSFHYTANVEVAYTLDTSNPAVAANALAGPAALPPAPTGAATELPYVLNKGTANEIDLGAASTSLAFLNTGLAGAPNLGVAPLYVQQIGLLAEYALARYRAFGLRSPVTPGARLKARVWRIVYGNQAAAGETRPNWDHIRVSNGLDPDDLASTVPHEIFHRVQFKYNPEAVGGQDMRLALREGGARFAEDCINDVPNDYIRNSDPVFDEPSRSIVPFINGAGTTFEPLSYEAGLLWKYFSEQLGSDMTEPAVGVDAHRAILEATATLDASGAALAPVDGVPFGYDPRALRAARAATPAPGNFDLFSWLDEGRTELFTHETTWGNYVLANLLHGTPGSAGDTRLSYLEDHDPVPNHAQLWKKQAAVAPADAVALAAGGSVTFIGAETPSWSVRYYRVIALASSPPALVRIDVVAGGGAHPLTQVVLIDAAQQLIDIHRLDATNVSKVVNMTGVRNLSIVVANRDTPGQHTLTVTAVDAAPLVTATRWNSMRGKSYEMNPRQRSWTWTSPDLMVDTDGDLQPDAAVFFGRDNALKLRVTNRGNAPAEGVTASFRVQQASLDLSPDAWTPVTDLSGAVQTAQAASPLAPGAATWLTVSWAPTDDGTHPPVWCVRAVIVATGDPNADDKVVLSNVVNVIVGDDVGTIELDPIT